MKKCLFNSLLLPFTNFLILLFFVSVGSAQDQDSTRLKIGGAVRFNTIYAFYENGTAELPTENKNGVFWDALILKVQAEKKGIGLDFEYRFYPGFNTHFIKKGAFNYSIDSSQKIEFGITQVPFGLQPVLGNSWWFQLPYYIGLEDDYDTGIKYQLAKNKFTLQLAYFLMADPRGVSEPEFGNYASARYSYDLIPEDGTNGNQERNQANLHFSYHPKEKWIAGFSAQAGQVYNTENKKSTGRYAASVFGKYALTPRLELKAQATHNHHPDVWNDAGTERVNFVNMGAYGFGTYQVAAQSTIWSAGLSYQQPVSWGPIERLTFYFDHSYMQKYNQIEIAGTNYDFIDSQHNVIGFLATAGNLLVYFDIASGKNQPWLSDAFGGSALSSGRGIDPTLPVGADLDEDLDNGYQPNWLDANLDWNTRLNINIGYYF